MAKWIKIKHLTLIVIAVFIVSEWFATGCHGDTDHNTKHSDFTDLSVFTQAFKHRQSNLQVMQQGEIIHILPDDTKGSRHQRFIIRLPSSQTLLIAHNIDIAPRIPDLRKGEQLVFHGEYEWTDKGGVIHWTHHDPNGKHKDGWLEYQGKIYQ